MPEFGSIVLDAQLVTPEIRKVRVSAPLDLAFRPGQYFDVFFGEKLSTMLSCCCKPNNGGYLEFAKRNTGSDFSKTFVSLKKGDKLRLLGPIGRFVLDESNSVMVFLSGGIGITPLRSMLQYATEKKLPAKIYFLYSNKTPDEIAFRSELEQAASSNPNFKLVLTITRPEKSMEQWNGLVGRIDDEFIKRNVPEYEQASYYICGPPLMVDAMRKVVEELGVQKEKIKTENFTGY